MAAKLQNTGDEYGILYICATPIGNLKDITYRAVEVLKSVDLIACEDTRVTAKLLTTYDIKTKTTSYHAHNAAHKGPELAQRLLKGEKIALVTDAGMPCISDPGTDLVGLCVQKGISVTAIPGPCAGIGAVSLSGMGESGFVFEGFLPAKGKARKARLERLAAETRTSVIYEAPHRLQKTLNALLEYMGNRKICICRELTKMHEQVLHCEIQSAIDYYNNNEARGEFVLGVDGAQTHSGKTVESKQTDPGIVVSNWREMVDSGVDPKTAVMQIAIDTGLSKREVYNLTRRK